MEKITNGALSLLDLKRNGYFKSFSSVYNTGIASSCIALHGLLNQFNTGQSMNKMWKNDFNVIQAILISL